MLMSILHVVANDAIETVITILLIGGGIITTIGLVGTIVPFIDKFQVLLVQIVGVVLLCAGIFFRAGHTVEEEWQAKVVEAQEQVRIAEDKSKQVNIQIKTEYVDRIKEVKVYVTQWKTKIVDNKTQIDSKCVVDPIAIDVMNDAALNTMGAKK